MTSPVPAVVRELLGAAPTFQSHADAISRERWYGDPTSHYLAAFADHVVDLLAHDETAAFPRVFATVERLLRGGDAPTRRLTGDFFLGWAQLTGRRRAVPVGALSRRLGPCTQQTWQATTEFHRRVHGCLRATDRPLPPRLAGTGGHSPAPA